MRLTLTLTLNPSHWVHHLPHIPSFTIPISNTQNKNLRGLSLPGRSDPLQRHCHGENLSDSQLVSSLSLQPSSASCQDSSPPSPRHRLHKPFPQSATLSPIHSPPHTRVILIKCKSDPVTTQYRGLEWIASILQRTLTKFLSMTMRPSKLKCPPICH